MRSSQLSGKTKHNDLPPLDAVDYAIMGCLLADPRRPVTGIARELGMVESTVRNRLNKLIGNGVVDFALVTNPLRFGFQVWAMLQIQVEPSQTRKIAERLAEEPDIHLVSIMSGSYDIFAGVALKSNDELITLITERLPEIPGIVRISTSTMLEMVKRLVSFGFPEEVMATQNVTTSRKRSEMPPPKTRKSPKRSV